MPNKLLNRPAVDALIGETWNDFVSSVEDLPAYVQRHGGGTRGIQSAVTYGQTHLRVLVQLLSVEWGRTKQSVQLSHRIQMALGEGELRAMSRDTHGGEVLRRRFMSAVAVLHVGPSIKGAFARGREDEEGTPYEPDTSEGR
jgi:hypothetical protein